VSGTFIVVDVNFLGLAGTEISLTIQFVVLILSNNFSWYLYLSLCTSIFMVWLKRQPQKLNFNK